MTPPAVLRAVVDDVSYRLAVRLLELREAAGLTQAGLALLAGVSPEAVARIERVVRKRPSANTNPSLDTLARLAEALRIDVAELFHPLQTPVKQHDRLYVLINGASPETRKRLQRVAEALIREEKEEGSPREASRERAKKKPK